MQKRVCVIGLGQFGGALARNLAEDCEVLAIDGQESVVNGIRDEVHAAAIVDVRDFEAIEAVLAPDFDEVIICISDDLETSILCALYVEKIGIKKTRAKASNKDHAAILKAIGVKDVFFPEQQAAVRKAQEIAYPDLVDAFALSSEYRMVDMPVPEAFAGKSLVELDLRRRHAATVVAIKPAAQDGLELLPDSDTPLPADGRLIILGRSEDIAKLRES